MRVCYRKLIDKRVDDFVGALDNRQVLAAVLHSPLVIELLLGVEEVR
jgi:hypothetical protein